MKLKGKVEKGAGKAEGPNLARQGIDNLRYVKSKVGLTYQTMIDEGGGYVSLCPEIGVVGCSDESPADAFTCLLEVATLHIAGDSHSEVDAVIARAKEWQDGYNKDWANSFESGEITLEMLDTYSKNPLPIYKNSALINEDSA